MPNIQTPKLTLKPLPFTYEEVTFEALAEGPAAESLLLCRCEGERFLLRIVRREHDVLIKSDKLTRPAAVHPLHKALNALAHAHDLTLTYTNAQSSHPRTRVGPDATYLKSIGYFATQFHPDRELWVEVGFGSGRHLLHQAQRHPELLFIGIEIHKPSIEQLIKQCRLRDIRNILVADFDARLFLELLPSNSVGRLFVHFPVPWDKKPHRRVISRAFTEEALRVLRPQGTLELRTDSDAYFHYAFETFMALKSTDMKIRKNAQIEVSSKYEDRWRRLQKNIYDLTLVCHTHSAPKELGGTLRFERFVPFAEVMRRFEKRTVRGEDFFVHFEALYPIDETEGLLKLSFGAYEKSEHKYLLFKDNEIQYFPNDTIPIKQNFSAHKVIEEFLYV